MAPSDSCSVNRCGHGHLACKFLINVTVPSVLALRALSSDLHTNGIDEDRLACPPPDKQSPSVIKLFEGVGGSSPLLHRELPWQKPGLAACFSSGSAPSHSISAERAWGCTGRWNSFHRIRVLNGSHPEILHGPSRGDFTGWLGPVLLSGA